GRSRCRYAGKKRGRGFVSMTSPLPRPGPPSLRGVSPCRGRPEAKGGWRLDSERSEPFVDIATLFAAKWLPAHIEKQTLFQSEWHHRADQRARSSCLRAARQFPPTGVSLHRRVSLPASRPMSGSNGKRNRGRVPYVRGKQTPWQPDDLYCGRRHPRPAAPSQALTSRISPIASTHSAPVAASSPPS